MQFSTKFWKFLSPAHGPVSNASIVVDKQTGVTIRWERPINANGQILHYTVTWNIRNATHEANTSENHFTFPNTTESDRFNITIRAYGVAGYGNPLILNSDKWKNLPMIDPRTNESRNGGSLYAILIIAITSLAMLACVTGYIVCRRDRYCKQNGIINSSEQSSFQPPISPLGDTMRLDEMYEMQTLIPTSQTTIMSNGKDVTTAIRLEHSSTNGGLSTSENQKILRTSTPTEAASDSKRIELPATMSSSSDVSQFRFDDVEKPSTSVNFATTALMDLNFSPQHTMTTISSHDNAPSAMMKDPKFGASSKVNGNLSPYKSLQVSMINNSNVQRHSKRAIMVNRGGFLTGIMPFHTGVV